MAEREAGRVVLTAMHDTGPLSEADRPFVATLTLARLPARDLAALYAGLIERSEALAAARAGTRTFRLAGSTEELERWRLALADGTILTAEIATLGAAMRKESRLGRRVELGEKIRILKASLDICQAGLE